MQKLKLPTCTNCNSHISFFRIFAIKTNSTYKCNKCGKVLNILYSALLYKAAAFTILLSSIVVILYSIFGNKESLLGLGIVFILFLIFYLITPFFIYFDDHEEDLSKTKQINNL